MTPFHSNRKIIYTQELSFYNYYLQILPNRVKQAKEIGSVELTAKLK